MSPLLEARDVQVRIGGTPILHAADLSLDAGRAGRRRRAQRGGQVDARARRLRAAGHRGRQRALAR